MISTKIIFAFCYYFLNISKCIQRLMSNIQRETLWKKTFQNPISRTWSITECLFVVKMCWNFRHCIWWIIFNSQMKIVIFEMHSVWNMCSGFQIKNVGKLFIIWWTIYLFWLDCQSNNYWNRLLHNYRTNTIWNLMKRLNFYVEFC